MDSLIASDDHLRLFDIEQIVQFSSCYNKSNLIFLKQELYDLERNITVGKHSQFTH